MSKSQEQRVKDAARVLSAYDKSGVSQSYEQWAAKILAAADREPTWPTDESLEAYMGAWPGSHDRRVCLTAAFLADPIIKAAIAYRDFQCPLGEGSKGFLHVAQALIDAVNEAGL